MSPTEGGGLERRVTGEEGRKGTGWWGWRGRGGVRAAWGTAAPAPAISFLVS